jgi:hypothetical protein
MKKDLMEKVDKIDLQVSEINLNLLAKIDQIDPQETERKKVLALKGNQVSEINLNLLAKIDQIDPQEMERKKVLALKGNQVLQKKIKQNLQALQIIQSILEKNLQKTHLQKIKKKALVLKERKNLRVEITDLKILALKNIVKKELNLKIF